MSVGPNPNVPNYSYTKQPPRTTNFKGTNLNFKGKGKNKQKESRNKSNNKFNIRSSAAAAESDQNPSEAASSERGGSGGNTGTVTVPQPNSDGVPNPPPTTPSNHPTPATSHNGIQYRHVKVPKTTDLLQEYGNSASSSTPPTTVMIRNIPNRYRQKQFMAELNDLGFGGCYDFLYLPMDRSTEANVGYAFVNFTDAEYAERALVIFKEYRFSKFRSVTSKIGTISVAHIQGLANNVKHYRKSGVLQNLMNLNMNSNVLESVSKFRPLIFMNGVEVGMEYLGFGGSADSMGFYGTVTGPGTDLTGGYYNGPGPSQISSSSTNNPWDLNQDFHHSSWADNHNHGLYDDFSYYNFYSNPNSENNNFSSSSSKSSHCQSQSQKGKGGAGKHNRDNYVVATLSKKKTETGRAPTRPAMTVQ